MLSGDTEEAIAVEDGASGGASDVFGTTIEDAVAVDETITEDF